MRSRRSQCPLGLTCLAVIIWEHTGTASVGNRLVGSSVPKLPAFDDKRDDMDAYLHRYEQYAIGNNWPKER